jgi:hypothetical protein
VPDPDCAGPDDRHHLDGSAYLVDFGPRVVRRAEAAVLERGISALEPGNLKVAGVTQNLPPLPKLRSLTLRTGSDSITYVVEM